MMTMTRPRQLQPPPPALLRICWEALAQTPTVMQPGPLSLAPQPATCSACSMTQRPVRRLQAPGLSLQHRPRRMLWCVPRKATSSAHMLTILSYRMVLSTVASHNGNTWQVFSSAAMWSHSISDNTIAAPAIPVVCRLLCISMTLSCATYRIDILVSACRSQQCVM